MTDLKQKLESKLANLERWRRTYGTDVIDAPDTQEALESCLIMLEALETIQAAELNMGHHPNIQAEGDLITVMDMHEASEIARQTIATVTERLR